MNKPSSTLTPQELEIMKVVWRIGRVSVRDVYEALRERRVLAYTTVMTMMKVLERKGHLKAQREGRAHVYTAVRPQQRVLRDMVREFLNRVFNGSAEPLVQHLVRDGRLTESELRDIVRRLERGN
ncbi:MAG TPA: BlaI/MecI/CopY family transcriptional regulator [Vicinamibacterales bacterium]|nr:BlaI/MecI/CopY family transcriptional regulator [Vicinamibacterales bacterium]